MFQNNSDFSESEHDLYSSKVVSKVNIILSTPPAGLFRDNLQYWLGDFARLFKVQFTSNEEMSNDAPIHECESEIDHCTTPGTTCPTLYEECVGYVPQIFYYMCKGLWNEAHGLSSLTEKTRKSHRLQMLLQRQHFLLSYL